MIPGFTRLDTADVLAIHQLLGWYGHLVDAAQWHRFDELFTPDATLDYTAVRAPQVFVGLEEIRGYFASVDHPSAHHVGNVVVYDDGDLVRVKSKFWAPFTRASHDPVRWFGGDYDDVVVPTERGWRFQHRTCTGRWLMSHATGPVPPGRETF
jgi:3-phenylpropionate/cinnamic acid dioxygenase small subunit